MRILLVLLICLFVNKAVAGPAIIWGPSGSAKVLNTQGGFLLNSAAATCATPLAGSLRWQASTLEVCDGSNWGEVGGSSSFDGTITGAEGGNAALTLAADESDDNGDDWVISSVASDNTLVIQNNTSGSQVTKLLLTKDGNVAANAATTLGPAALEAKALSTNNYGLVVYGTDASHAAFAVIPINDNSVTFSAYDNNAGAIGTPTTMRINNQGGDIYLSNQDAGNDIFLVGRTSCTALTTDGSNILGCTASDERLKKDIVPFDRGLTAIEGITPKSFKFKSPTDMNMEHSGFIAQNIAAFIPEAVSIDAHGFMMLDYWTIIATQANAIKELSARVKALETAAGIVVPAKPAIPLKPVKQVPKHTEVLPCIGKNCAPVASKPLVK